MSSPGKRTHPLAQRTRKTAGPHPSTVPPARGPATTRHTGSDHPGAWQPEPVAADRLGHNRHPIGDRGDLPGRGCATALAVTIALVALIALILRLT